MEMQLEEIAGTVTKASLIGKMDIAGAMSIDMAFSVMAGSRRAVVVDLSQCSFIASMGLRTLVVSAKSIGSKRGKMVLLSPNPDVEKVIVDSGIDSLIPIHHDLAAAVADVGGTL